MNRVSGSVLRAERDAAGFSQEELAKAMQISVKTVQRMEHTDVVRPRDVSGYRSALDQLKEGGSTHRTKEEIAFIVDEVRQKAMRFNVRRAQGAPDAELRHLRAELEFSIRAGLKAGTSDADTLNYLTAAFFDLMTSESLPPADSKTKSSESKRSRGAG